MAPPSTQPVETVHRADDFVTIDRTIKIFSGDGWCKQNPSAVGHSDSRDDLLAAPLAAPK